MQPEVRESVSKFMAFVHGSVNEMSKQYLTNERRYNYTTPKSFLELVSVCVCMDHILAIIFIHMYTCEYTCINFQTFMIIANQI